MRHIDFAAANNLGGVLVEGWNEDWATWKFSFTKPYTDFDIQRITDYGRSKGVALIGHHETGGNVSIMKIRWKMVSSSMRNMVCIK